MQEVGSDLFEVAKRRIGQVLCGKITIESVVDVGGMAAVYAATHRNGKRLAVKMLHAQYAANPDVTERFLREGYVANQIEHSGSVEILDDDISEDGAPFLVMELLVGESFDRLMRRGGSSREPKGTLPPADVLGLADQVLDVLEAFHQRGIIHRDIKPANLFITTSGTVKVLDFGLARVRDARVRATPTASGTILGTASYMSPEQAQGKTDLIDARTDIFAMGAVMYHALTGQVVHKGKTSMERLLNAMQKPAEPIATYAKLSEPVCELVDRSLRFDKNERFGSAQEMRAAVRHAIASEKRPSPAVPIPAPPPSPRRPPVAAVAPPPRPPEAPAPAASPSKSRFPSAADMKKAMRRVQTSLERGPTTPGPLHGLARVDMTEVPPAAQTEPNLASHIPNDTDVDEVLDVSIAVDFVEPTFDGEDPPTRERPR